MAVALASTAMASARNEQEASMQRLPGFVDQLTEFQQGSFYTQQECTLERQSFARNGSLRNQTSAMDDRASCYPPSQAVVKATSEGMVGKHHGGEFSYGSPTIPHGLKRGESLKQEKGPVYVPPHRQVNPGRLREKASWREKSGRFEQGQCVLKNRALGLERAVIFNRSLPVDQGHRRGQGGEQYGNEKVSRENVMRLVDCQRSMRPLMADCEDKADIDRGRYHGNNKSVDKARPILQTEKVAVAGKQEEREKSLGQSTSAEKNKFGESCAEMKGSVKGSLEKSLSGRKSSKEKSGSEKKRSSGKRKGKSSSKRSQSPEDPPTLSSNSIEVKGLNSERLDRSDCSSSGYSFELKNPKPALRLKMPAKVPHRGKDVFSSRDRCMIGGSCSSLVRTATGI